ncbi:MAG: GNAT family N-acetyltransferase [archaeon]|nr:GNAT family N-acetyltransferase [archaeon]
MNKDYNIRKIKKEELGKLLDLYKQLHPQDAPLPKKQDLESIWEEIYSNPLLYYNILEYNEIIVSSCTLAIIPNLTRGARPFGIIENVITHKEYRNCGYATTLLIYTQNIAWDLNCYKVMLLTGSKDPKILNFYDKVGFKRGIKTGFIAYPS